MITAGPTREPLDPAQYSNHSSGKMVSFGIAVAAARRGANVTLVSGPVSLPTPPFVNRVDDDRAGNGSRRECFWYSSKYFIGCRGRIIAQLPWPQKNQKQATQVMN